ncbi:MAG: enoyl-CoA hydratase/isomerase family protein [Ilumatobacteraceae bacterium]|jgi:2-(1,2-epoxy-1,2-dihydrophenyl)acetyl-CoA isomerase
MTSTYETILWEREGGVGTLTINRPAQFNGITMTMLREVHELLHEVADDETLTVVVVTGAGKAFCPGADLKHYTSGEKGEPGRPAYFDVPVMLHEMPQVTVAAINGACAGAGLGWACGCDLRFAARSARLNTAFLDVAVAGDMGLPWTLPRIVGAGKARELSLLPRKLSADEAAAIGLVNGVFDDDTFRDDVAAMVATLASKAPLARRAMKQHYVAAESTGFAEYIAVETEDHRRIIGSDDCREAFRAFVEKRAPRFTGR